MSIKTDVNKSDTRNLNCQSEILEDIRTGKTFGRKRT